MQGIVRTTARLILATGRAWGRKWSFLGLFALVTILSFALLDSIGLTPDPVKADAASPVSLTAAASVASTPAVVSPKVAENPVKIAIPKIALTATIANPISTDIEVLDRALLAGAVRYPTSAHLGEAGNVVLFGHSSYLPVVNNQAYKTFDGIQKLVAGDTITVYSSTTAYTYAVDSMTKENANFAGIPLSVSGSILTLATCNSFGTKSDRFVVTAHFVESHPLTS